MCMRSLLYTSGIQALHARVFWYMCLRTGGWWVSPRSYPCYLSIGGWRVSHRPTLIQHLFQTHTVKKKGQPRSSKRNIAKIPFLLSAAFAFIRVIFVSDMPLVGLTLTDAFVTYLDTRYARLCATTAWLESRFHVPVFAADTARSSVPWHSSRLPTIRGKSPLWILLFFQRARQPV